MVCVMPSERGIYELIMNFINYMQNFQIMTKRFRYGYKITIE